MRRKLKLNLEDLQVESFDVSHAGIGRSGTVYGRNPEPTADWGCETTFETGCNTTEPSTSWDSPCGDTSTCDASGDNNCGTGDTIFGCGNDSIMTCPCEFCYGPTNSCGGGGGDTSPVECGPEEPY